VQWKATSPLWKNQTPNIPSRDSATQVLKNFSRILLKLT